MKNIALEFKNVSFSYDKKEVLKNISFCINEGKFFVLLGLNGAGKSTIFSLATRLLKLQKGEIFVNNFSIKDYSNALKDIGIVFQEPTLDLDLTVKIYQACQIVEIYLLDHIIIAAEQNFSFAEHRLISKI